MVTSIPTDVTTRVDKFKYVARQLRVQSGKIEMQKAQERQRLEEQLRTQLAQEAHQDALTDGYGAQPHPRMGELPDQAGVPFSQQDARVLQPPSPSNALGWAPAPELPAREAEDQAFAQEAMPHQPISKAQEEPAPHMLPQERGLI